MNIELIGNITPNRNFDIECNNIDDCIINTLLNTIPSHVASNNKVWELAHDLTNELPYYEPLGHSSPHDIATYTRRIQVWVANKRCKTPIIVKTDYEERNLEKYNLVFETSTNYILSERLKYYNPKYWFNENYIYTTIYNKEAESSLSETIMKRLKGKCWLFDEVMLSITTQLEHFVFKNMPRQDEKRKIRVISLDSYWDLPKFTIYDADFHGDIRKDCIVWEIEHYKLFNPGKAELYYEKYSK